MAGENRSSPAHWRKIGRKTDKILNVRTEIEKHRTWESTLIERIGLFLARPVFFLLLLAFHLLWVLLNLPVFAWFDPWDPYPFQFLGVVASVEAPFLTLLVLMRQQRDSRIDELREEIHLQVSLHMEREITMTLRLLDEIGRAVGAELLEDPKLLARLKEELDPEWLMEQLRHELREADEDENDSIAP